MVSKYGSPIKLDGLCVLVMHSCRFHICVLYACGTCTCCVYTVVVMFAVVSPCEIGWCVVGCGHHECMSIMRWLCMLVILYFYTYIEIVIVVMRDIMVCIWYD